MGLQLECYSTQNSHPTNNIPDKVALKGSLMFMAIGRSPFDPVAPRFRAMAILCSALTLSLAAAAQQPQPDTPQQPTPPTSTPAPTPALDAAQPAQAPVVQQPPSPVAAPSTPDAHPDAPSASAQPGSAQPGSAQPGSAQAGSAPPGSAQSGPAQQGSVQPGAITEEELKQQLVGKQLYLRGGYLGDSLNFDEHGHIVGHPPKGSYTLSVIQVDHVRLTKHKVEIEGIRFGLHFNEQLAYEDSSKAYDKVRITPKKKIVKITIDREMVVNPKKKKESAKEKVKAQKPTGPATPGAAPPAQAAAPASGTAVSAQASAAPGTAPADGTASESAEMSEADQLKASIAATPEAERPADPTSVTTTTSQAHANKLLIDALDAAFAPGLDDRMMAAMPDFWKLYYQAVAAKSDYKPSDPSVLRQNTVDTKAKLVSKFEPESNEFAQANGVAGMALYHTVIGADGKPGEIAVARPIGFGLDENAVAAIRKASFEPATKDGKPVPVMLDLVVQFRIYSKRTAVSRKSGEEASSGQKQLPGPYSLKPVNP
jgi:TonB family protein